MDLQYYSLLFTPDHCFLQFPCFVASVLNFTEPRTYKQTIKDPQWVDAMNKEIEALFVNNTWDYMPLPLGKKPILCRWDYKIKLKSDGSIERYKACLVAKGFTQRMGIDYNETFTPVVKMSIVRSILVVVAYHKWQLSQLDINNTFLHGDLSEEVYMLPPEGVNAPNGTVCKLRKSL
ncbi:transmembrane signal receptor [Lithospermum erythrorhizon]|uniref:Transmembrane signal receptor n=1 Tax=Lithospermum erythrorhizon TaxID=34254 RepID=A0AAV3PAX4_LITER